jgi:hypothetical protein
METALSDALFDSSIADTAEKARQLLLCCQKAGGSRAIESITSGSLSRFSLWASNIGVFLPDNASLDYRLRTAPAAKVAFEASLETLCEHLLCGKATRGEDMC